MNPSRRQFLRSGGATIVGTFVLGACTGDVKPDDGDSSDVKVPPTVTPPTAPATAPPVIDDLTLARTAASLEALAIAAYGTLQSIGLVKDTRVLDVARLHVQHHQQHLEELNRIITQAGAKRYSVPNAAAQTVLVDPILTKPRLIEADMVKLAYDLEVMVAQAYTHAAGVFSTPALRSTCMTIGGTEARHAAAIGSGLMQLPPAALFPASLARTDNPLPPGAWIAG